MKKGSKHSEETKRKISQIQLGKKQSRETIEKRRLKLIGKKRTEETKQKISESRLGKNNPMYGKDFSEEHRRKLSEARKKRIGEKNPSWNGGRFIKGGYLLISIPKHPNSDSKGYVSEHRLIMEKRLGRYLEPEEVVHHVDNDRTNNNLENLMIFANNGEHLKHHKELRKNGSEI